MGTVYWLPLRVYYHYMDFPGFFKWVGTNCKKPSRIVIIFFKTGIDKPFFMVLVFSVVLCYDVM